MGLLEKVRGEKSYGYDYITKLGYDKFEQRSYLKYCNGAETFYTYDNRRRLSNLAVNSGGTAVMDNDYTFDAVSNVLSVANNASLPSSGNAGGQMSHAYTYDGLYRLVSATGTYMGADSKSASYTLAMGYDNMHRITSKSQHLTQDNVQFNGTLNVGYDLSYTYGTEAGKKFRLANVKDVNYRTEETPGVNNIENNHVYSYDKNGNLVYVNTGRMMNDGHNEVGTRERKLIWDEENRLLAVDDNGFVSNYWYDADGERTVKTSGESDQVYVNGVFSGGSTNTAKFSLYVSPYLVANQGGRYTKHIYAGSQRIVSKVGDFASYGSDPRRIEYAGANTDGLSVDYKAKYAAQQQVIKGNYKTFDVPYNGTDNDNYADGEGFCCNDGTQGALLEANKARSRVIAKSFKDPDNYENLQFFYHPDHLGSSSFITNLEGEVVQHIEYVPFGEVFIEERNNTWNTPYLFNAKEFDEETGMYYYGARYYEPRLGLWMSTDPKGGDYPNVSSYCYTLNNPIIFMDVYGLYPKNIVIFHKSHNTAPDYYKLTKPAVHLLSLVSSIPESYIEGVKIWERGVGHYLPWYSCNDGGGAITLGSNPKASVIVMTQNYFEDNPSKYNGNGDGQNFYSWIRILSHEVGHLKHIEESGNIVRYGASFLWDYIFNLSHDNVPREVEAEKGRNVFNAFNRFVNKANNSRSAIEDLFNSDKSDKVKIATLNKWWQAFISSQSKNKSE